MISTPNAPQVAKVPCNLSDPTCDDYKTNGQKIVGTEIGNGFGTEIGNGYIMAGDLPIEELPGETQV